MRALLAVVLVLVSVLGCCPAEVPPMKLAVLNQSTILDPNLVPAAVAAIGTQLRTQVAPAWGVSAPTLVQAPSLAAVPAGALPIVLLDDADQAGALGYHAETPDGRPYARVFVKPTLVDGGTQLDVMTTLSHEAIEALIDPHVNLWAMKANGDLDAVEGCDAVQGGSYEHKARGVAIPLSDFVLPAYFDPLSPPGTKLDFLGLLSAPFSIAPGGYIVEVHNGQIGQVFGSDAARARARPLHPASRTYKRLHKHPG